MVIKRIVLSALLMAGAGGASVAAAVPSAAVPERDAAFTVTSSAFEQDGTIPKVHECTSGDDDPQKKNESPPLAWSGAPDGARSYALVMRDLSNSNLIHWVIYDIPADVTSLPQNVEHSYKPAVPAGARQVYYRGSASLFGYQGPCSPTTINTYEFRVHALDKATLSELDDQSSTTAAARAIEGASLGSGVLSGKS